MKGNFHVRFWSRVGKSDLLHLGNKHDGVKDKAVNSGKKVMNQPERLGINVIKFIGRSWGNWWLSCESGVIKLRIG